MPYYRKAPRQLRRHFVTLALLERTNQQVSREMTRLGIWSDALGGVCVYLVPVSLRCYGWHSGTPGAISIPAVSLANLGDYMKGYHMRLRDVLRHEYAHAVADLYPGFVDCRAFEACFGGSYAQTTRVIEYDPSHHLTRYASTMPAEDYAEAFHFYLRHGGRLPHALSRKPPIIRKWDYMVRIARAIAAGRRHFR